MMTLEAREAGTLKAFWLSPSRAAIILLAVGTVLAVLSPGYVGGTNDSGQYLDAAACWLAHGPCLPDDHWSARWPLIAPLTASIALFGETRASISLPSFLIFLSAAFLLAHLANRLFRPPAGLIAGLALMITPIFFTDMLRQSVDQLELCFLLAGAALWLKTVETEQRRWALLMGLALSMAVHTRETSLVWLLIFGLWFLKSPAADKRLTVWAAPTFLASVGLQSLIFQAAAGDPLLRLRLALAHTRIPSAELSADVDTSRSPLLNPDFIAGWKPANGIEFHWIVDPLLNLATHPAIWGSLAAALFLWIAAHQRHWIPDSDKRKLISIWAGTSLGAALLIYVLAIDPKPRMFLPLICAACITIGATLIPAWRDGSRLLPGLAGLVMLLQAANAAKLDPSIIAAERQVAGWLREHDEPIATDMFTRSTFRLVPGARDLSIAEPEAGLQLFMSTADCRTDLEAGAVVEGAYAEPRRRSLFVDLVLRLRRGWTETADTFRPAWYVCLVRYRT